ncbi:hypothetical protein C9374_001225 [Naegleria lovaniensis]|uniref:Uncharacterized protein n=1 Tax=Naegleria lovaniensis TaxID=51637 RepID=A0AA88GSM4_NAELO|nr:uncharacterized protein C9374_001225 [Naegleria lovaniensis]KAG2387631.1 hypothetical protein C9374_001225 [Naegleria lovaniensis]
MKRHTLTALSLPNTTTTTTTTTHSPIAIYEGQKGTTNTTSTAPSSLNTTMNTTPRKNALPFLKDISPTLPQHLIQNGTTNTSESGGVVVTTSSTTHHPCPNTSTT